MPKHLRLRLLVSACVLLPLLVAQTQAPDAGAQVKLHLDRPGFVTVAIDDDKGKRVRNLFGGKWLEAGEQSLAWDGLDDAGEPLSPGNYRWKGLVHDGLQAEFQGAFNSAGSPPWMTAEIPAQRYVRPSGGGGWLSDHAAPYCAFSDGERVYFGAKIAEAGNSIIELDLEGRKLWGTLWLGLSGANAIFKKNDVLYVAGEKGWMRTSLAVHRLNAETHRLLPNPKESEVPGSDVAFIKVKLDDFSGIKGMVVTDEYIVLSLGDQNRLALFDVESGQYVKSIPLPDAGAIVPSEGDSFLAISGTKVVRLELEKEGSEVVVDSSLVEPVGLAVSSRGDILVSDVAEAEQVIKIFSPQGQLKKTLGKAGGHQEGLFDPQAMNNPRALAVDAKDQVWVGENSFMPKRISVWTMDGQMIRDWMGPPEYGGGGTVDLKNSSRAFYKGMEFTLAPWPETSQLRALLFEPKDHLDLPIPMLVESGERKGQVRDGIYKHLPQAPVYQGDRLYLLDDQGYGVRSVFIGEKVEDRLIPRAIFSSLARLKEAWSERHPEFIESLPTDVPKGRGVFLWQDTNGDGKAEPEEVQIQPDWRFGAMWAMRSWPTLNLYARSGDGKAIMEVAPESGKDQLSYDLESAKSIPLPDGLRGVTALSPDLEGNLLINTGASKQQGDITNMFYSVAPNGEINWTYPNPYPANWHNSPRLKPGDIQHTLNVEGVASLGEGRGDIFQLNGNKGVRFLLTTDGLYVGQLYGDMRNAPTMSSAQEASLGLRLDTYSLGDECFLGWMGKTENGEFLQVVGKDSSNVMKITGLDTLQRLKGGEVRLEKAAEKTQTSQEAIPPIIPVQIGAIGKGWEEAQECQLIESDPEAAFAFGYRSHGLTLSMTVKNTQPFANSGEDPKALFKTGTAVDLRISTAEDAKSSRTAPVPGDMRFIFSMWRGEPVAVRYRFVVPGTKESDKSKFASPTGVAMVDQVSVLKDVKVKIKEIPEGWRLTAFIPWKALGLKKAPQKSLRGDVGLILSDPEGTRAVARHYYYDRGSQVVSDLPSEVRVDPSAWGEIEF